MYNLLQDSQGRRDSFERVFMLFCLHIEVKEITVQAKKFLSSTMHPKSCNPCVMGSDLYQWQQQCLLISPAPQTEWLLLLAPLS